MPGEKYRIICLDLDGTLIDSNEAHAASFNMAFEKNGLRQFEPKKIISKFGPPAEKIIKMLFPQISDIKIKQIVADKRKFLIGKTAKMTKPIPGVDEALKKLKKDFKLVVYSHSTREEIEPMLAAAKLDKNLFATILDAHDIHEKPDPDIIDAIEEKANGKVLWIAGDTTYDIRTGNNAGVKTIAVLTGAHTLNVLKKERPTMILESIALLPEYFEDEL